jgi:signal transduction histidine kinase
LVIINTNNSPVVLFDSYGIIKEVNPSFASFFNIKSIKENMNITSFFNISFSRDRKKFLNSSLKKKYSKNIFFPFEVKIWEIEDGINSLFLIMIFCNSFIDDKLSHFSSDFDIKIRKTISIKAIINQTFSTIDYLKIPNTYKSIHVLKGNRLVQLFTDNIGRVSFSQHISDIGIIPGVFRTQKSIMLNDISGSNDYVVGPKADLGAVKSELAVPIIYKKKCYGVINLEHIDENVFTKDHQRLLEILSKRMSFFIKTLFIQNQIQTYEKRLLHLHDYLITITKINKLDKLIKITNKIILHIFECDRGSISFIEGDFLVHKHWLGKSSGPALKLRLDGPGNTVLVVNTKKPIMINQIENNLLYVGTNQVGLSKIKSELAVPIILGESEVIGVINLESPMENNWDEQHLQLLELYSSYFSLAYNYILKNQYLTELERTKLYHKKQKINKEVKENLFLLLNHEMKTPLTSIIGFSELLHSQEKNEKFKEFIKIIFIESNKLLNILNNIIQLSKIQSDNDDDITDVKKFKINLTTIMNDLYNYYFTQSNINNISLEWNNDHLEPVLGNQTQLHLAISNIISNAFKYTIKGNIKIYTYIKDDYNIIVISDTGMGVSKKTITEMLNINSGVVRQIDSKGSGIGFNLAHKIIKDHGGSISIKSKIGKGTSVEISLPIMKK